MADCIRTPKNIVVPTPSPFPGGGLLNDVNINSSTGSIDITKSKNSAGDVISFDINSSGRAIYYLDTTVVGSVGNVIDIELSHLINASTGVSPAFEDIVIGDAILGSTDTNMSVSGIIVATIAGTPEKVSMVITIEPSNIGGGQVWLPAVTYETEADAIAGGISNPVAGIDYLATPTDLTKTYLCRVNSINDVFQCIYGTSTWLLYSQNDDYINQQTLDDAISKLPKIWYYGRNVEGNIEIQDTIQIPYSELRFQDISGSPVLGNVKVGDLVFSNGVYSATTTTRPMIGIVTIIGPSNNLITAKVLNRSLNTTNALKTTTQLTGNPITKGIVNAAFETLNILYNKAGKTFIGSLSANQTDGPTANSVVIASCITATSNNYNTGSLIAVEPSGKVWRADLTASTANTSGLWRCLSTTPLPYFGRILGSGDVANGNSIKLPTITEPAFIWVFASQNAGDQTGKQGVVTIDYIGNDTMWCKQLIGVKQEFAYSNHDWCPILLDPEISADEGYALSFYSDVNLVIGDKLGWQIVPLKST